MSLLLDALKKAAEQKAEKAKSEGQEAARSDETEIDVAPEDISGLESGDESNLRIRRSGLSEETELDDQTELQTRLERTRERRTPGVCCRGTVEYWTASTPFSSRSLWPTD